METKACVFWLCVGVCVYLYILSINVHFHNVCQQTEVIFPVLTCFAVLLCSTSQRHGENELMTMVGSRERVRVGEKQREGLEGDFMQLCTLMCFSKNLLYLWTPSPSSSPPKTTASTIRIPLMETMGKKSLITPRFIFNARVHGSSMCSSSIPPSWLSSITNITNSLNANRK